MRHFFMNTIIAVFRFIEYRKRLVLRFLKFGLSFCIFKIDGDIAKLVQI